MARKPLYKQRANAFSRPSPGGWVPRVGEVVWLEKEDGTITVLVFKGVVVCRVDHQWWRVRVVRGRNYCKVKPFRVHELRPVGADEPAKPRRRKAPLPT